jgi:hypothetical protein
LQHSLDRPRNAGGLLFLLPRNQKEDIMPRLSPVAVALSLIGAVVATPAEAAQRAFVSSSGSDANASSGCGIAMPCRTFGSAMSVVSDGGEIVALDAAGYGPVAVDKSVTITSNPGFYAGIAASTGTAVTINTAGINVTLRGLTINNMGGIGSGVAVFSGTGIKLSIENCVISNFTFGVSVTTDATVRIVDSLIRDGGTGVHLEHGATAAISGSKIVGNYPFYGVYVYGTTAGTTTTAAISDTILTNNGTGVFAVSTDATAVARASVTRSTLSNNDDGADVDANTGTAVLTISNSMVTGNVNGLSQGHAGSTLESLGNNTVRQNGTDSSGTITTVSSM